MRLNRIASNAMRGSSWIEILVPVVVLATDLSLKYAKRYRQIMRMYEVPPVNIQSLTVDVCFIMLFVMRYD